MVDVTRALLDELMGKERDAPLHERSNRKIVFSDDDVCKHELVGVCPNQLFKNTRSDLGELLWLLCVAAGEGRLTAVHAPGRVRKRRCCCTALHCTALHCTAWRIDVSYAPGFHPKHCNSIRSINRSSSSNSSSG